MTTKPLFKKVAIIGVGLIGASLGLGLRRRRLAGKVLGWRRNEKELARAKQIGAIDEFFASLEETVEGADLLVLAMPVLTNVEFVKRFSTIEKLLDPKAVIIDVGSTKKDIEDASKIHLKSHPFVGCHPMAGSETPGLEKAAEGLYEGSICFIVGQSPTVQKMWEALGARVLSVSADAHDQFVAGTSHIEHLLSFALLNSLDSKSDFFRELKGNLNPSLEPLARLAQSDPDLWADIFWSNRHALFQKAALLQNAIGEFTKCIRPDLRSSERDSIAKLISRANQRAKDIS